MHDSRILAVSDLYDDLKKFCFLSREMCFYGDLAYPLSIHLQASFRVGVLTRQMEICNEKMSAVRASVEWLFAEQNKSYILYKRTFKSYHVQNILYDKRLNMFFSVSSKIYVITVVATLKPLKGPK